MKPYAQWTHYEVVDHVCREVPETVPPESFVGVSEESLVLHWAMRAAGWMINERGEYRVEGDFDGVTIYFPPPDDCLDLDEQSSGFHKSDVHALGAAVLLAAGKVVPE